MSSLFGTTPSFTAARKYLVTDKTKDISIFILEC